MSTRIQLRRGTAAQWASANPVLLAGEEGLETDTGKVKIGDGATAWAALKYRWPFDPSSVAITGGVIGGAVRIASSPFGPVLTAFAGDSLTNDTGNATLGPQEYYTHALELAGGAMMFGGKFGQGGMGLLTPGTGGKTWTQTKQDLLSASVQPQRVVLLIGTNDLGAGAQSFAAVKAAYIQAVADLRGFGYEVVVSELPPRNDMTTDAALALKIHTFNTWVNRWSRINGLRCMRMYAACVDTAGSGAWTAGWNRDSIHPNFLGAKAMAQACWDACGASYVWKPYLAMASTDLTGLSNPVMLTDATTDGSSAQTAGDGIPDNWGKANSMSGTFVNTMETGADVYGKWYKQLRDTSASSPTLRSVKVPAAVGDLVQFACRLKTVIPAGGSGVSLLLSHAAGTSWVSPTIGSLFTPVSQAAGQEFSTNQTVYIEARCTIAGTAAVMVDYTTTNGSAAGGSMYLGQMTLRNLTQLGIE